MNKADEWIYLKSNLKKLWPYLTSYEQAVILRRCLGHRAIDVALDYNVSRQAIHDITVRARKKFQLYCQEKNR